MSDTPSAPDATRATTTGGDLWAFCRDLLVRGQGMECEYRRGDMGDYERYSARTDAVASHAADVLADLLGTRQPAAPAVSEAMVDAALEVLYSAYGGRVLFSPSNIREALAAALARPAAAQDIGSVSIGQVGGSDAEGAERSTPRGPSEPPGAPADARGAETCVRCGEVHMTREARREFDRIALEAFATTDPRDDFAAPAPARAAGEEDAGSSDPLHDAYVRQIEHTNFVRAEYQRRLAASNAARERAERERDALKRIMAFACHRPSCDGVADDDAPCTCGLHEAFGAWSGVREGGRLRPRRRDAARAAAASDRKEDR